MAFYTQVGGNHGEIAVVGDFDADAILPLLTAMVDGWTTETSYERLPVNVRAEAPRVVKTIEVPGKANAVLGGIQPLPVTDAEPDAMALVLADRVIGGGSSSRLWSRLREKEGFSYGVSSLVRLGNLDPDGSFIFSAIVNPTNVPKAAAAADEEISKFISQGPTQADLEVARDDYLKNLEITWGEEVTIARVLREQLYLGRTMHFEDDRRAKLRAVTPEDALAAARKWLDPSKMTVVEAGDLNPKTTTAPAVPK